MKLTAYLLPILAAAGLATASTPTDPDTYVKVRFEDGTIRYYKYGECYPYEIDGVRAQIAIWLKSTTCFSYRGPNCTGAVFPPLGVPVPGGTPLVNAADFVRIIGKGAICYENKDLPAIPLIPGLGL